jgi:hypothetical protein
MLLLLLLLRVVVVVMVVMVQETVMDEKWMMCLQLIKTWMALTS